MPQIRSNHGPLGAIHTMTFSLALGRKLLVHVTMWLDPEEECRVTKRCLCQRVAVNMTPFVWNFWQNHGGREQIEGYQGLSVGAAVAGCGCGCDCDLRGSTREPWDENGSESCALDRWKRYVSVSTHKDTQCWPRYGSVPTHKDTQCWPQLSILCGLPEDHFLVWTLCYSWTEYFHQRRISGEC